LDDEAQRQIVINWFAMCRNRLYPSHTLSLSLYLSFLAHRATARIQVRDGEMQFLRLQQENLELGSTPTVVSARESAVTNK
jgi:hypothetical protein